MSKAFPKVREFARKNKVSISELLEVCKRISKLNLDMRDVIQNVDLLAALRADFNDMKQKRAAYESKRNRKIAANDAFLDARSRYLAQNDISLEQLYGR